MNKTHQEKKQIWALVPAAGVGARMAADKPKQYISINGRTILEHTLSVLLAVEGIAGVQLCLSPEDAYWPDIVLNHPRLLPVIDGGVTRADSVLAGLQSLSKRAKPDDWVLVHDAARPCLTEDLLKKLIDSLFEHSIGGILAVPVADTIKQVENLEIKATVNRNKLWAAQTPQMFRFDLLKSCLEKALKQSIEITDEASCIEAAGFTPMIVPSVRSNIKVTYPEDVDWVNHFLSDN